MLLVTNNLVTATMIRFRTHWFGENPVWRRFERLVRRWSKLLDRKRRTLLRRWKPKATTTVLYLKNLNDFTAVVRIEAAFSNTLLSKN